MIYIDLQRMIGEVLRQTGVKITLGDICEGANVNRNVISKLNNNPTKKISSDHLERLIEYFYLILRHSPQRPEESESGLAKWVLSNLVHFYSIT